MQYYFDHEKLIVYQKALSFLEWMEVNLKGKNISSNLRDQLERSSTSIVLNIAEGNGKSSSKDRCRYFDIALGSTFESAASIDIIARKNILNPEKISEAKSILKEVASMIVGLIKSNSDRVYEAPTEYNIKNES